MTDIIEFFFELNRAEIHQREELMEKPNRINDHASQDYFFRKRIEKKRNREALACSWNFAVLALYSRARRRRRTGQTLTCRRRRSYRPAAAPSTEAHVSRWW